MVRLLRKKGQPIFILMIFLTLLISVPFQPALAELIETETVINPDRIKDTRVLLNQLMARGTDSGVTSCLLIIASFFIQPPAETTPLQSGNFEQPQNSFPECGPLFATRKTISLPHLNDHGVTS
jgi:hypothetical protein